MTHEWTWGDSSFIIHNRDIMEFDVVKAKLSAGQLNEKTQRKQTNDKLDVYIIVEKMLLQVIFYRCKLNGDVEVVTIRQWGGW